MLLVEKVKLIRPTDHPFGVGQTIGPSNTGFFKLSSIFFYLIPIGQKSPSSRS
jgi:hypothetical protein